MQVTDVTTNNADPTVQTAQDTKKQTELLNKLTHEALLHKKELIGDRWKTVDKYFQGKQSRFEDREVGDEHLTDSRTNLIYPYYLSSVAVLMRDIPMVSANGILPDHDALAQKVSENITRNLRKNEFVEREEELLFSVLNYGSGFLKTTWDKRMNRGVGDIRIDTISAKNILKQPGKVRLRDSHYIVEMTAVSKLDLLMMYPNRRRDIMLLFADRTKSAELRQLLNTVESDEGTYLDGTGLTIYHDAGLGGTSSAQRIVLYEIWMNDPETVERYGSVVELDTNSGLAPKKRKRHYAKYPTGRYIRWAGDIIFEDKPNPFPDFPYSEMVHISDDMEWPGGAMDQLIAIQDLYDLRNNQLNDGLNYSVTGDKTWMDARTGIKNRRDLTNRPGEIGLVASVDGIKTTAAPRVPGEAFVSIKQIQEDFDRVGGSPDIVSQLSGGDWRSGYAVDAISELVRGRLKLATYSLETTMRDLAQKNCRMQGMFYQPGVHYPDQFDLTGVHPEMFEFTVRAGLNLPSSRRAQEQFLLQMLDRAGPVGSGPHSIMYQYVLSQTDLPMKESLMNDLVSARDQDMKMAAAQQQSQQENEMAMQQSSQEHDMAMQEQQAASTPTSMG